MGSFVGSYFYKLNTIFWLIAVEGGGGSLRLGVGLLFSNYQGSVLVGLLLSDG